MFGRLYSERWGQIGFWACFVGFNITFFTQFVMGSRGMPRRYFNYLPEFQLWHQLSSLGSYILAVGFFIVAGVLIHSLMWGGRAPPILGAGNPGVADRSLPPVENFLHTPEVGTPMISRGSSWTKREGLRKSGLLLHRQAVEERGGRMSHDASDAKPGHSPYLAHHFESEEQQFTSAKLGMWVFLVTEVLLFGGLFAAYAFYRANHPEIFISTPHQFLDKILGGINTIVLICSSLTMAWAVRHPPLLQCGFLPIPAPGSSRWRI